MYLTPTYGRKLGCNKAHSSQAEAIRALKGYDGLVTLHYHLVVAHKFKTSTIRPTTTQYVWKNIASSTTHVPSRKVHGWLYYGLKT